MPGMYGRGTAGGEQMAGTLLHPMHPTFEPLALTSKLLYKLPVSDSIPTPFI